MNPDIEPPPRGDPSSAKTDLVELDRRFRGALMAYFTRRVRDRNEAEDLPQEVFVRLARSERPELRQPDAYFRSPPIFCATGDDPISFAQAKPTPSAPRNKDAALRF